MISYDVIGERLKILQTTQANIAKQWEAIKDLPEDVEANITQKMDVQMAHAVMQGRILECRVWREWIENWPRIEMAAQLPTERNTLKHDAIPEAKTEAQGKHEREQTHRSNADQLSAALPDLG